MTGHMGGRGRGETAVAVLMAALMAIPADALAEEAGTAADSADVISLDEVAVTARKITEDIRAVPFSVTAVTRRMLDDANIQDTEDLYRWVPNFNFTQSGLSFANLLNIRGIGSSSALISPAVVYYVDGIPVPTRVFDQRFVDVQQIEVLRGPQGTLFGLNAQAGAVTIATGDPTRSFEGMVGGEIGSYGRREVTGLVSGPVSDTLALRLTGQLYGYDGDIENYTFAGTGGAMVADQTVRAETFGAVSGKAQFTPDDATMVMLAANYRRDRQRPTTGVLLDDPQLPRNAYNPVPETTVETGGLGLTITRDFDMARLTSVTGFSRYTIGMNADILDGFLAGASSGLTAYVFQSPTANVRTVSEANTQWTQELRLDGEIAGIRWVGGVSAFYSSFSSTTDITSTAMANGAYTAAVDTFDMAGFGEVTVPLTDRLRWIVGLRATHETKDFSGTFVGRSGPLPAAALYLQDGTGTYDFVTGRTGLSYDLTPTLSAYATIARGEKPGGYPIYNQFAAFGIPASAYGSARTWSYEAGVRGNPFSERIEVSAAVFYNDTSGEQLFTYNPTVDRFDVQNADTRTYGAELELKARLTEALMLTGSLAVLDTEITDAEVVALIGNVVPYAPDLTGSLALEYRHPLAFGALQGEVFGRAEYQYVGGRAIDPANSRILDAYSLVNLRAGWKHARLDLYGYVENLFDESYVLSAFQSGTTAAGTAIFAGIPGTGRAFGAGARMRF
ncbi:MAG: hypothetical protein B7Z30_07575 [Rhizobiales bacterium 12-68-15]|nr:MAG: hypothetical protein B7Z30_07575 [Rhizobiales bacterium 12-68-15]